MSVPDNESDNEGIRKAPQPKQPPRRRDDPENDEAMIRVGGAVVRAVVTTRRKTTDSAGHTPFPGWAAPPGGAVILGVMLAWATAQSEKGFSWPATLIAAGCGFILGLVVWLCDKPSGRGKRLDVTDQGSFAGRFLALLSLVLFCLPFVGLVFASCAVFANWRRGSGWPWLVSRLAFALAFLLTAWFLSALLLADPKK